MRVIKKYRNRKLYDVQSSKYVTLKDLLKIAKTGTEFRVIDNKTKNEITGSVLLQALYESEKSRVFPDQLSTLKRLISQGQTFSSYLELKEGRTI